MKSPLPIEKQPSLKRKKNQIKIKYGLIPIVNGQTYITQRRHSFSYTSLLYHLNDTMFTHHWDTLESYMRKLTEHEKHLIMMYSAKDLLKELWVDDPYIRHQEAIFYLNKYLSKIRNYLRFLKTVPHTENESETSFHLNEFPRGAKLKNSEDSLNAAIREFIEETHMVDLPVGYLKLYPQHKLKIMEPILQEFKKNILYVHSHPIEYTFQGGNGHTYKYVYYMILLNTPLSFPSPKNLYTFPDNTVSRGISSEIFQILTVNLEDIETYFRKEMKNIVMGLIQKIMDMPPKIISRI